MIYFIVLLFFFLYSFGLFFINHICILSFVFLFHIIISLIIGVPLKKHCKLLSKNMLFILFIIICNLLFSDIYSSFIIGIKLFLAIDYTYIMGYYFTPTSIRIAFRYLFYPLKLFQVDVDSLTLILAITLSFIPILMDEALIIKYSLQSKGFDFKFHNLVPKPHIYLITFLNSLFDRLNELEKCMIIKAYIKDDID